MSEAERKPDFLWAGRPVYRCRVCRRYERIENLAAVLEHESSHFAKRESSIVGADGKPLIVDVEEA